jgi:hypothetical protein
MVKLKKYLIVIPLYCFVIKSCDYKDRPSHGTKLSGGYTIYSNGGIYLFADNTLKPSIYGNIAKCDYNKEFILVLQNPNKSNFLFNLAVKLTSERFILSLDSAKCSPKEYEFYKSYFSNKEQLVKVLMYKLTPFNSISDIDNSQVIADSIITNDPYYKLIFSNINNYWIISHKEIKENDYMPMSKIYGPYNKEEYRRKKIELNVPKELELNQE